MPKKIMSWFLGLILILPIALVTYGEGKAEVSVEPHLKKLRIYEREGRYEEAIIEGKMALEINPEDERVYSALRSVYTLAGKYKDALKISEKLLEIVKSKGLPVCGYIQKHALILEYAGRQNEAIRFLEGYRESCPKSVGKIVNGLRKAKSKGERFFPFPPPGR